MKKNKNILVVAAHPDDEILGCGGSLLYFRSKGYRIKVIFMADGESSRKINSKKKIELINKREKQAKLVSNKSKFLPPIFCRYPDNQMDSIPLLKIVKKIEKEIKIFKPKIIFTHFENDLNIDHRITFNAVLTATRPKSQTFVEKIFCFEVTSSTNFSFYNDRNKIFNPNVYIDIKRFIKKKLSLLKLYKSEMRAWPHPRSMQGVKNLAKNRGSQIGVKFSEAFINIREIIK